MIKQTDYSEFFMKIQRGKQRRAGRFCFYGTDGIGKTFFASAMKRLAEKIIATEQSKKVLILDVEKGSFALDVAKIELAESTYVDIGKTTTSLIN
jgi:DNA replication protein DnaC